MNTKTAHNKWWSRSLGVFLLFLIGYGFYNALPSLLVMTANTLSLVVIFISIIGGGYVIYGLLR